MATLAPYDGPGVYDRPYQVKEAMETLKDTLRVLKTDPAKLRAIDEFAAFLTAYRARVVANTETNEELYGQQHTVLATGAMTTIPVTRP